MSDVVAWERDGHVKSAADMLIRDDGFGWPKGGPEAFGWTPLVRLPAAEPDTSPGSGAPCEPCKGVGTVTARSSEGIQWQVTCAKCLGSGESSPNTGPNT